MYQSTIFGTSVRPRAPPNAEPFQTRPVTSWNGRVEISVPDGATPMMIDFAPAAMAAFERLAHRRHVADAFERKVGAAAGDVDDRLYDVVAADLFGIDEMRHAEFFAVACRAGLMSTPMILSAPTMRAPWITLRPMPPRPKTTTLAPGQTFAV